jgi:hypothetical protein
MMPRMHDSAEMSAFPIPPRRKITIAHERSATDPERHSQLFCVKTVAVPTNILYSVQMIMFAHR